MKTPFATLFLLAAFAAPVGLLAQVGAGAGHAGERGRISAERRDAESAYTREQAACYGKFAVNDCLNGAKARRREALADLRRQEISLNDEERRRKGAVQQQRIDDKSLPQNQQRLVEDRARAQQAQAERTQRSTDKALRRGEPAPAGARPPAAPTPAERGAALAAERTKRAAEAQAQAQKRSQRLQEAQERREKLARQQKARTKPPAKPLPVLP